MVRGDNQRTFDLRLDLLLDLVARKGQGRAGYEQERAYAGGVGGFERRFWLPWGGSSRRGRLRLRRDKGKR